MRKDTYQEQDEDIELGRLLLTLWHHAGMSLLCGILCAVLGFLYSVVFITPLYESKAMMIVNPGQRDIVTSDQINSAEKLVDTYSVIITSDTVMDQVISNLSMEHNYKEDVKFVGVEPVNGTQVMEISVLATDPQVAQKVCTQITQVAPGVIVQAVKAGSMELVSAATLNEHAVSPNRLKNAFFSFLGGFLLSSVVILIYSLLNSRIKEGKDLQQDGLILMGIIPAYRGD